MVINNVRVALSDVEENKTFGPSFRNPPQESLTVNNSGKMMYQVRSKYQDNQKFTSILLIIPNAVWVHMIHTNWRASLIFCVFLLLQLDTGSQRHHNHRFSNQIRNGSCVVDNRQRNTCLNLIITVASTIRQAREETFTIINASTDKQESILCKLSLQLTPNIS